MARRVMKASAAHLARPFGAALRTPASPFPKGQRLLRCPATNPSDETPVVPSDTSFLSLLRARQQDAPQQQPGDVFLVGTGPGDPSLLTVRALHLLQRADVVLYDRLVSDDILRLVHGDARMVYVGKQKGLHTRTQQEIHELLLQFAEAGATVVRLKGGDPYVFGRGGEELEYLESRGIRVHCVPGITAAAGICAELGIPMTHRGVATSVRFLTGHAREGGWDQLDECVSSAGDAHTTLVVYMGLGTLPTLTAQLRDAGLSLDTPAVAVERGTTARQRVVFAPLGQLQAATAGAAFESPTLIVIGEVVALGRGWAEVAHGAVTEGRQVPALPVQEINEMVARMGGSGGEGGVEKRRTSTFKM